MGIPMLNLTMERRILNNEAGAATLPPQAERSASLGGLGLADLRALARRDRGHPTWSDRLGKNILDSESDDSHQGTQRLADISAQSGWARCRAQLCGRVENLGGRRLHYMIGWWGFESSKTSRVSLSPASRSL